MFERAAIFSASVILLIFTYASLSYYNNLASRKEIEIVRESN